MSQIDRNLFLNLGGRQAARQRRTRLLVSAVAGAVLSVGALTTLQAASAGSDHWSARPLAHGATSRLLTGVDTAGAAPDALSYAVLAVSAKPAVAAPVAAETAPVAIAEADRKALSEALLAARSARAEAVLAAIDHWAEAWQKKDVAAYLAAYGEGFQPANGARRGDWAKLREQRIADKRVIKLELHDIGVVFETDDRAVVKFVQDYRADRFVEQGTAKSMVLAKQGDGWRILAEESTR